MAKGKNHHKQGTTTRKDQTASAKHGLTAKRRKRRAKQHHDPSAQYLSNPQAAPLVQAAQKFFPNMCVYQNGPKGAWRTVSKLPVRRSSNNTIVVGLFQPHSHSVGIQQQHYPAHHASINAATTLLAAACQEMGIDVFDETNGTGYLRYVAMNVERATGKVQLTLIWKDDPYEGLCLVKKKKKKKKKTDKKVGQAQLERLLAHLLQQENFFFQLHSLWVHYNNAWKHSNAIFDISGNNWVLVHGPKTIQEKLPLANAPTLHFGPNVFRQANIDAFSHIVANIRKRLQRLPAIHCLELYGGVGTIGLHLLESVATLVCSDENPHNGPCFQASKDLLEEKQRNKCSYVPYNAEEMVQREYLKGKQVVIVDPPRKGLDSVVLDHLVADSTDLKLLVYVSCGFEAFQRDFRRLVDSGKWKLEHAEGHILFPGANAIETLAYFVAV